MNLQEAERIFAGVGWRVVGPSASEGWWTFSIAEHDRAEGGVGIMASCRLTSDGKLTVIGFDQARVKMSELDLTDEFALPAELAEALSGNEIDFSVCVACARVRERSLACEGNAYCSECRSMHYYSCSACLAEDAEPERDAL